MLEYEDALARILAAMPAARPERVPPAQAHRRILLERIVSPLDLPPFDNSAMDGHAVRAGDLQGANPASPTSLRLRGRVAAGESFRGVLEAGDCVRIFTGSPLPPGADAVVMQEDTRADAARPDHIQFLDAAKPWENVRFRGEDVKQGVVIGEPGTELGAGRLGLLAALGITGVAVGVKPLAGLLASGSELVEAGRALPAGGIYESNRASLAALVTEAGGVPKVFPLVADTPEATRAALATAFDECDVVVTTGGVSVGEYDFIKSAFEDLGGALEFWKVALKPGRPFTFGRLRGKFLFGLPGNPVSAFVTFLLLVRPALRRWQGAAEAGLPRQSGILTEAFSNPGERRHYVRVRVEDSGEVRSAGAQASHLLGSLAAANALLDLPPQASLAAGARVQVLRWE